LRWAAERAAIEFGTASGTLRRALDRSGAQSDSNECYTTAQIIKALYGDLHSEKVRVQRELGTRYELENEITRGEMLNKEALRRGFAQLADALQSVIMTDRNLTRESKEDFLKNLASWPIILSDVERRQTRLPKSNGEHDMPQQKQRRKRVKVAADTEDDTEELD
jgi:hypothetical protein